MKKGEKSESNALQKTRRRNLSNTLKNNQGRVWAKFKVGLKVARIYRMVGSSRLHHPVRSRVICQSSLRVFAEHKVASKGGHISLG